MKLNTKLIRTCVFFVCIANTSFSEESPERPENSKAAAKYSDAFVYKALTIKGEIYLRPLNGSKPFGPFKPHEGDRHRLVYYPDNYPQEFGYALQFYRTRTSKQWRFTNNQIKMMSKGVDVSDTGLR